MKIACCSNSIEETVVTILKKLGIFDQFDLIISNEDIINSYTKTIKKTTAVKRELFKTEPAHKPSPTTAGAAKEPNNTESDNTESDNTEPDNTKTENKEKVVNGIQEEYEKRKEDEQEVKLIVLKKNEKVKE